MIRRVLSAVLLLLAAASAASAQNAQRLLNEGRVDEAVRQLSGARDGAGLEMLCRAWRWQGEWTKAVDACSRAAAAEPNSSRRRLWLARVQGGRAEQVGGFAAFGLARKVRDNFEKAHQMAPGDVEAARDLAEFYLEAPAIVGGGVDKAERLAPSLPAPVADWIHAKAAEKRKDAARAEALYRQAVRDDGFSGDSWLDLARFFRSQKRWAECEEAVGHAVSSGKRSATTIYDAAGLLFDSRRNAPLAERLLRQYLGGRTVEDGPAFAAHWMLGELLRARGDRVGAQQQYAAALALASGYRPALKSMQELNRK